MMLTTLTIFPLKISGPLSVHLLYLERNALLPSIPARGHGLILLIFWTLTFVSQNLSFLNLQNEDWWFDLQTTSDYVEFTLFIVRYLMTCCVFLLGLKAPGLYTTERLYRDGLVSGVNASRQQLEILHFTSF